MLDPQEVESYMVNAFATQNIPVEVVFNGVDISIVTDLTQFTYSFTVIYYDVYQKYHVETHLREIQRMIQEHKGIDQPCEIVLAITVG